MTANSDRINFLPVREVKCQTATEIKLPCLMVICGSVCVILKVRVILRFVYVEILSHLLCNVLDCSVVL